jgi:hypothetical protein
MPRTTRKLTFEQWKQAVDDQCSRMTGLSVDDLPDCPYRDWYENGITPLSAARMAIRLAKE